MQRQIAAAIFESKAHAERAIKEIRDAGVSDEAISVVSLHEGETRTEDGSGKATETRDESDNKATGALKGLAAGGTVGAVAGLGALFIPGIGPFIAAGALAEAIGAAGSAALVSGAVGATAGGLTGALVDYGMDRKHAEHYEKRIREGGVFVAVDTGGSDAAYRAARAVLRAAGGDSVEAEEHAERQH